MERTPTRHTAGPDPTTTHHITLITRTCVEFLAVALVTGLLMTAVLLWGLAI